MVFYPLRPDHRALRPEATQFYAQRKTTNKPLIKANLKVPRPDVERRRLERYQKIRLRPRFYKLVPEEVARRRDFALVEGHVRARGRR